MTPDEIAEFFLRLSTLAAAGALAGASLTAIIRYVRVWRMTRARLAVDVVALVAAVGLVAIADAVDVLFHVAAGDGGSIVTAIRVLAFPAAALSLYRISTRRG